MSDKEYKAEPEDPGEEHPDRGFTEDGFEAADAPQAEPAVEDQRPDEDESWRATNGLNLAITDLKRRLQQLKDGKIRMLVVSGPTGLNKSGLFKDFLTEIYNEGLLVWEATPETKRPDARTRRFANGQPYYYPPFEILSGEIQPPAFFEFLHKTAGSDEWLVLDDVESLNIKANRIMLHQASDGTREGVVNRLTNETRAAARKGGYDTTLHHHGKIAVVTNLYRDDKESRLLLGESLQTKAVWIEFPRDVPTLVEYVDRTAFVDDPKVGLYRYLLAPKSLVLPEDERGLEYLGENPTADDIAEHRDECLAMLADVRNWFLENTIGLGDDPNAKPRGLRAISYRILKQVLRDRRWSPEMWLRDATVHLKPE